MRFWGWYRRHHIIANNTMGSNVLHLDCADVGKTYTMLGLEGGQFFREKIYSMGLNPGVKFTILLNSGHGPIEIQVRQTKLAIGRFMAHRIKIRENGSPD
jgi:Fe2+ transport system protein FeoA